MRNLSRLGGARFEEQAIAGIEVLKTQSEESTINRISELIMKHREDVLLNGSQAAIKGLKNLDEFLQQSALLYAQKTGGTRQ